MVPTDHICSGAGRAGEETAARLQGGAAHLCNVPGELRATPADGQRERGRADHSLHWTFQNGPTLLTSSSWGGGGLGPGTSCIHGPPDRHTTAFICSHSLFDFHEAKGPQTETRAPAAGAPCSTRKERQRRTQQHGLYLF